MEEKKERRPFDLLASSVNGNVLVKLKNGSEVRGRLLAYDVHMNLILENAEELEEGEVKRKIGTIILRGGNILFMAPQKV
ncbi:MAG: LSM domain-containing protein [Candidatus Micrarchaeia archaeon]|jgi:small nuclear ribonucleoprotein